ncbi:MAG: DUF2157 domain-containing protein [Pseudomonadota bacterium]
MSTLLERQINDWLSRGVIDGTTAEKLRADITGSAGSSALERAEAKHFSFFKVLAGFAVLTFVAGVLLFIAANWDGIPRLVKVGGVLSLILVGFLGGAFVRHRAVVLQRKGRVSRYAAFFEEVFYTVGGAAYVGGVALVGQMYHVPGALDQAMFGFAIGLVAAGALVRSRMLVLGALFCALWWYQNSDEPANLLSISFLWFLGIIAVGYFTAHVRSDKWLRRAAIGALLLGLSQFAFEVIEAIFDAYDALPEFVKLFLWHAVLALAAGSMWFGKYKPTVIPVWLKRYIGVMPAFLAGFVAVIALHALWGDSLLLLLAIGYGVVFAIFTLVLHGARHRVVRYFAYVLFVAEVAVLFGDTIIGLLNSSVVLIVLSVALALLAFLFYRIERRFNAVGREGASS